MAKTNISFNNKNYSISDSALSAALAELKSHLSTKMNGTGATINLDGTAYNIDSAKLSTATNAFVTHLGKIAGSGHKVKVGGVEYGVGSDKVAGAVAELETVLGGLNSPDVGGSDTLYWDGNTEGLESASVAGMTWYKVSDVVPTKDDCVNGVSVCLHMSDGSEPQIDVDGGTVQSLFRDDGSFAVETMIIVIPADNYLLVPSMGASVQFQKAGIYFIRTDEGYPSKFTINGYAGF